MEVREVTAAPRPVENSPARVAQPRSGPFPLVLGVTGHRDLRPEDGPALTRLVSAILTMLRERYPNTPVLLLSPLAEGADRLVASVALEEGAKLVVPLPLPVEEYERDFAEEESLRRFRGLLARADEHFALPLLGSLDDVHQGGEARNRQYEQVGAYIARHSQILIALWDGRDTGLVGGTSRIVSFQLSGVPPPYAPPRSPLDQLETGLVYHIVTPRRRNPTPLGTPLSVRLLTPRDTPARVMSESAIARPEPPDGGEWVPPPPDRYDQGFGRLDLCNADAARLGPMLKHTDDLSQAGFPAGQGDGLDQVEFERNARAYIVADCLAVCFAHSTRRALVLLGTGGFLAVAFIGAYHWSGETVFVDLYAIALLGALFYWRWIVRRRDVQDKYLDYRALAEGLRVQSFWRLAGIRECAAEHYLRKQKSELDWIRNAIRVTDVYCLPCAPGDPRPHDPARYDLVRRHWVDNQRDWYAGRTARDRTWMSRSARIVSLGFAGGLALAILAALILGLGESETLGSRIFIISTIPLAAAGLWRGIANTMAYEDQSRQYSRMYEVFRRAAEALRESIDEGRPAEAEAILTDLGKEALAEHADWVVLHRARPLEVPKA